ncbi:hypothetical protein [Sorangium sp. So ce381]|uniref:hypothetical protein n=1 Tax=Sorangium sp. So ce381 TaxID=3133307 RepID=UPI003F5AEE20
MIPAESRLPEAPRLVEQMACVVVHAPRQTGKTTAQRAVAERLTASGRHAAVLFSCEEGSAAGDDYGSAQRAVLRELTRAAQIALPPRGRLARTAPQFSEATTPRGRRVALLRL